MPAATTSAINWGKTLGGLAQTGSALYGYDQLQDEYRQQRDALRQSFDSNGNKIAGGGILGDIRGDIQDSGTFQPWSVRSGLGQTSYDPATGQMNNQLNETQQGYSDFQGQGAQQMFGRAMQDPAQRETDVYNRIRAMQAPGEQRQYDSMNSGMFGSGRGGMSSAAYGGSPEQHAFGLAQGEARNQASYQAMGQAQQEMQNYAGIGQQMFGNQYVPGQQMQGYSGQGLQNEQMRNQSGQNMAGLLAQLGIGGMTTDVNWGNVQGESLVGLLEMLGQGASGGIQGLFGGV
jgi:hypothetical protein